jgi:hypothetical protein
VSLHVYGIDSERVSTHVNRVLASVQRVAEQCVAGKLLNKSKSSKRAR